MGEAGKILADAMEKIRQEAYASGWRDCAAAITKAVNESRPGDLPSMESLNERAEDAPITSNNSAGAGGQIPTVGTVPHYVLAAVKKRPGSTGAEIIAAIQSDGHKFDDRLIRTSLFRLDKRKVIVNRHKKWFPL